MNTKIFKYLLGVCVLLLYGISYAEVLSPTFLPMLEGEWRVDFDHDKEGQKSEQRCFALGELLPIYTAQTLLEQAQANKRKCRMTAENTRNSQIYLLKCDEQKLTTMDSYKLTKEAYNKYVLERSLTTIPYTRAINYVEKITFTRIGRCAAN
ncbi:hypothetical protein [Wohlfahrtiimonas populi]|uniref:hypothetical protein n=1 Tax=Wohlfahrtiimonas populi TaxID=1940240 RepID=UPI00117E25D9|nr:hypothetical protein [Wohlfahrtiimonas populi]